MAKTTLPQWLIDAQAEADQFAAYAAQFEAESQERLSSVSQQLRNVRKGLMKQHLAQAESEVKLRNIRKGLMKLS